VSLQRTPCFGTCPVYSVQVGSDGLVSYDGERFVAVTGHQTRRISRAAVQRLRRQVIASGFMALPEHSGQIGTDLPSQTIVVTLNGRTHGVTNHNPQGRTPRAFARLAAAIDAETGAGRWVGPRPQRRCRAWRSPEGGRRPSALTIGGPN
jgi:hypothetical protein